MRRGTTPTLHLEIDTTVDLTACTSLYVTLKQDDIEITKEKPDCTIDGQNIYITLTQAETLSLHADGRAELQVRGITDAGKAFATTICAVSVGRILKDGVIT